MTTFYIAINPGSDFATAAEERFDKGDNDKSLSDQRYSGVFQQTSLGLNDHRTLYKIEGDDIASEYITFLDSYYPKQEWRMTPAARRHYQSAEIFLPDEKGKTEFLANVTEEGLDLYTELFGFENSPEAFADKWFHYDDSTDSTTGVIGTVRIVFGKSTADLQWLTRFVTGLERKMAEWNMATDAPEEAKLAFVYNLLGDEGMNLYILAKEKLSEVKVDSTSFLETGMNKWHVTEGLIRRDGTYSEGKEPYGINCHDAPFTHALDDALSDECTAYFEFGGTDRAISHQEMASAEQNAGSLAYQVSQFSDQMVHSRRTIDLGEMGKFEVFADMGWLYLGGQRLVWTDRSGKKRYNLQQLSMQDTRDKLHYLQYQLNHIDSDSMMTSEFKSSTLALVDSCLARASYLQAAPMEILEQGKLTDDGAVLQVWYEPLEDETEYENLCVLSVRGMIDEVRGVSFENFDRYIRHIQGEITVGEGGNATKIANCDDGVFTGAIDTSFEDESARYYGLMSGKNVTMQLLDELYSYSHGAAGVKKVMDHFTREAKTFSLAIQNEKNGTWKTTTVSVDPDTDLVLFNGKELTKEYVEENEDALSTMGAIIEKLRASGGEYSRYAGILQTRVDKLVPPAVQ